MKKFLAALLALSLTFGSVALPAAESGVIARGVNISASAETYGDFEYDFLDDGTIEITKYTGEGEKVVIPSAINGKYVTVIGDYAFINCSNLTEITIPNSITRIDIDAFLGCFSLGSIIIPDSVTSIGEGAFQSCASLTSIIVDSKNKNYTSENGILFNKDKTEICAYPVGKFIKEYKIPDSVISIGKSAFQGCIGLTNIAIPDGVTNIGWGAFFDCSALTSITIPKSVTKIGNWAFNICHSLTDVYYTGSADDWDKIEIGDYNKDLTNATIHYNYDPNHTHSYTEKITKQPTCTATGEKIKTCSICGMKVTETIPAKGHTAVTDKAVLATCTTNGKTAGSHCSVCGKVIKAQTVIKAKGHTSSSWIIDKQPAVGVKGSKHKECTVCHKVLETAEIPALSATDISGASVKLSTNSYTYNGKAKKPAATVTLNGKTLKKNVDYTVKYSSNTAIGKAKVTITGKGNYKGTVSKTFKILPAKQTIAKITSQKKGFAVKWTKDTNVTGYQIQYDVKSDLKSAKSTYVKTNSTYKKTISGLKAKKTYYVRVRSYKTVGGVKYYGSWSANKKIKTK